MDVVQFPCARRVQQARIADVVILRRIIRKLLAKEASVRDELIGLLIDGAVVEDGEHSLALSWSSAAGRRIVALELDGRPLGEITLD